MSGDRVLVTGGAGFIGVNLVRVLKRHGWDAIAFDNFTTGHRDDAEANGFDEIIEGDIRDRDALTRAMRDSEATKVVHLAAQAGVPTSIADPFYDCELNVLGTLNALVAARDAGVGSFVMASSNAPLGEVEPPSSERVVPKPLSPYGASKLAGEAYCSAFAGSYGLATTALRFANVYGPFSYHKGSVVAGYFKAVQEGRPLVIYGDGTQTRDFVFVEDLAEGIAGALTLPAGKNSTVHLGSGTETTVNDLATFVLKTVGEPVEVVHEPARAGEVQRSCSDISNAQRLFGFDPSTRLEDGLSRTWDWFVSRAADQKV
ncbi:MAG: NAD-dependent epimerase/dehydratase family protein [Acidimicrobiia bacterium]